MALDGRFNMTKKAAKPISKSIQTKIDDMMEGLVGSINVYESESVVCSIAKLIGVTGKPLRKYVESLFVKHYLEENSAFFEWCEK